MRVTAVPDPRGERVTLGRSFGRLLLATLPLWLRFTRGAWLRLTCGAWLRFTRGWLRLTCGVWLRLTCGLALRLTLPWLLLRGDDIFVVGPLCPDGARCSVRGEWEEPPPERRLWPCASNEVVHIITMQSISTTSINLFISKKGCFR